MANKTVTNLKVALQSGTDRTIYATWSAPSGTSGKLDHYNVQWKYFTGDGVAFIGQDTTEVTARQSTYSAPSNATKVRVRVKPVAKTHKVNGKDTKYFTGEYTKADYNFAKTVPATPSAPTVTIKDFKLTARLDTTADYTDYIQFQVVRNDSKNVGSSESKVTKGTASWTVSVSAGYEYKVRCRAINAYTVGDLEGFAYSDWSEYSSNVGTVPTSVSSISCQSASSSSVAVTFSTVSNATKYTIEYATQDYYFDSSNEVQSVSEITSSPAYITGLESGQKWYFRIKAVNDNGDSGWSKIVSTVIGTTPSAPTTWSSTTSAIVGETVTLFWVHNSEDGSKSRGARIKLTINGTTSYITVANSSDVYESEDEELTYSYELDLSGYTDGATILWQAQTKGITGEYSDWSTQRQIDLYAPATLALEYANTLETFPYSIEATAGPSSQTPVCYTVIVTANETHESTNEYGNDVTIVAGQTVFSKTYYTSTTPLTIELTADTITLTSAESYTVTVTVAMDTGLTAEMSFQFTVSWAEVDYDANASISIDTDALVAYIAPYCEDEDENLVENVVLSVYRREFDGTFTEIGTNLENTGSMTVTDPHPALDSARYRIVVRETDTGVMSYTDLPGEPIDDPHVVIQWDEQWAEFDYDGEDEMAEPTWSGSMIKLLYNIDTTEEHSNDVALVEYIGRSHPVSYYGTQKGETATWSCVIDKEDTDTLYALRRLAVYQGDVYVRNPSGVGYWAQVTVGLSDTHAELTIPVTLTITRVEGGM